MVAGGIVCGGRGQRAAGGAGAESRGVWGAGAQGSGFRVQGQGMSPG